MLGFVPILLLLLLYTVPFHHYQRYVVFKEKLCSEDIGVYETFGIKSTSFDEGEKFSFSDISVDEAEVTKLCEKCNELDVSPVHMTEIIEDFILNVT